MNFDRLTSLFLIACLAFFGWALLRRLSAPPPPPEFVAAGLPEPGEVLAVEWPELGVTAEPTGDVLLVFLSADCPWSRVSLPAVDDLADELGGREAPVQIHTIVLGDTTAVRHMMEERDAGFPYHVPGSRTAIVSKGQISRVPFTLLVDADRIIRATWRGQIDGTRVQEIVAEIDGEPRPRMGVDRAAQQMSEVQA